VTTNRKKFPSPGMNTREIFCQTIDSGNDHVVLLSQADHGAVVIGYSHRSARLARKAAASRLKQITKHLEEK